ncbi:hypothetical protein ABZS66_57860 [Dactylosporangium sp. NPDC005572]|uniref:hypothetical protein n=1 Tax=Dactylosporangium sp. NPDC005572 TaxID=3156889 RepID=UPI0033B197AE
MTDHLAALWLTAGDDGAWGSYRPGRVDLRLRGAGDLADRLVHYHEAEHIALTASTAWGGAMLVAAQVPGWERLFEALLDRCRTTHESFATFASCSAVAAGFGSPEPVLAAYPDYAGLVARLDRYLAAVAGAQRRALAATALARACMQGDVLEHMAAAWPRPIALADLRRLDHPDERLEHLLRAPAGLPLAITAAADATVAAEFGLAAIDADLAGGRAALDEAFDAAWARWEDTVYDGVAGVLRRAGATVLGTNGHLATAARLTALVEASVPGTRLVVDAAADAEERRMAGMVLAHARLWLAALPRPGRLVTVGADVGVDEVLRVVDATSRIQGRPNLVLSARRAERLRAGYVFPESEAAVLAAFAGPVVGVRSVADDGTDTQTDAVWFARLPRPADAEALARAWAGRGDLTCCVAVSCLDDAQWRAAWLPALRAVGPLIWLVDVGASALAGELGGQRVQGLYLDLGGSPAGARRGLTLKAAGQSGAWLFVGDDVGVELFTAEVAALPGVELTMTGADWAPALPAISRVLHDLLHAESYLDQRGRE